MKCKVVNQIILTWNTLSYDTPFTIRRIVYKGSEFFDTSQIVEK